MLNARHNKDKHNGPGLSGWMHSVSGAPSWLQCPSPTLPCSPPHTGWLCTVSFVSEHALQLFWLEAVETLCLCACLLRFCVVYSACTCSMQHAACGLFVYLPQQQHSLQQQLPRGCQSMASRLHKHQCASFLQPSPPLPPKGNASVAHCKVNALMRLSF